MDEFVRDAILQANQLGLKNTKVVACAEHSDGIYLITEETDIDQINTNEKPKQYRYEVECIKHFKCKHLFNIFASNYDEMTLMAKEMLKHSQSDVLEHVPNKDEFYVVAGGKK
jgi:hypothetical protein